MWSLGSKKRTSAVLCVVIVLAVVANILFFSAGGGPAYVFAYDTNSSDLGQSRMTPFSTIETKEWGSSNSKTKPNGEWDIQTPENLNQNYLGGGWANIWYKVPNSPNFKAEMNLTLRQSGQSSSYPKYGIYGAYQDENNYVLGLLDVKFNSFATFSKVDGMDGTWKSAVLPQGTSLQDTLNLKSIKIGNKIKFYVNGYCIETLTCEIGGAQPGLLTEDCVVEYADYAVDTQITKFDDSKEFPRLDGVFGQAAEGAMPNGDWKFENGLVQQMGLTPGWCGTYYGSQLMDGYRFSVDVRLDEQDPAAEYPKYGVYAYYKDSDNYVVSMLDPKYNMLSTFARIGGKDADWQGTALPAMDYGAFHTLSVAKSGGTIDFFVDGFLLQTRSFALEAGQPGLIVEQCRASYKNYRLDGPERSAVWGASYDGAVPVIGSWKVTAAGGAVQSALGEQMTALFYGKTAMDSYKAEVSVRALGTGETDYPKYGLYAGHHSADSFVWVFLHPKENIISSYAKVNGADQGWNSAYLPAGFDFSESHSLKGIKLGSEFRFYVDGQYLLSRVADIGSAQVGLVTSDCSAEFGRPSVTAASEFDNSSATQEIWGNSYDNHVPQSGSWKVQDEYNVLVQELVQDANAHTDRIFYNGDGRKDNYRFTVQIKNNGVSAYPFAKLGVYAAYENENSYIYTFIHPKEKMLSVFAIENGVVTQNWETFALPFGFDYDTEHELKIMKLDGLVKIYVDEEVITAFSTSIGKAQIGLISEGVLASYRNISWEDASQFDTPRPKPALTWGNSADEKTSAAGSWEFDGQGARQTVLEEGVNRIFYRGASAKRDYRMTANLLPQQLGESPVSKFGFYAAYEDPNNYAWVFLHPKEKFLSVVALENGQPVVNWQVFPLPSDFDYSTKHELKVIKLGSEFRVYADGVRVAQFTAEIGASQVGFITESVKADFSSFSWTDASAFEDQQPPVSSNWGDALDGKTPVSGSWKEENGALYQTALHEGLDRIFYRGEAKSSYKITTRMEALELGVNPYAKMGLYAAYQDAENYVWLFLHPKEHFVSVLAVVNNAPVINWQIFPLPADFDYGAPHDMKIIKLENEFRVYLDGQRAAQFTANIGMARPGLITEGVRAEYTGFMWDDASAFEDPVIPPVSNWGNAADGKALASGNWQEKDGLLSQQELVEGMNQTFFQADAQTDYKLSAKIKPLELGVNPYAKMGYYAAYEDPNNYAWVFLHPKEHFLSAFALVDGVPVVNWQIFALPNDFDYSAEHELTVERRKDSFRILVDGTQAGQFTADLDAAQVGVIADSVRVQYANFVCGPLLPQPPSLESLWGPSADGLIPVTGSWSYTNDTLTQSDRLSDGFMLNLYRKVFEDDYSFSTAISGIASDSGYLYPKVGLMLAYHSPQEYVYFFLHTKEGIYSLYHPAYGFFQVANLPAGLDLSGEVTLGAERRGMNLRVSINGSMIFEFVRDMGAVQVGVVTEHAEAVFGKIEENPLQS